MRAKAGTERNRRRLRAARAIAGFGSARDLAARVLELNLAEGKEYELDVSTIGKMESGIQRVAQTDLDLVAKACRVPSDWRAIDALIDASAEAAGLDLARLEEPPPRFRARPAEVGDSVALDLAEGRTIDRPPADDRQQNP